MNGKERNTKTNALRPGEFRICPRCATRQKGFYVHCQACGVSLAGALIAERAYSPVQAPPARPLSRGVRAVLVLGVVGAATIGIVLRSTFTNAAFDAATPAPGENRLLTRADTTPDASVYDEVVPTRAPEMPAEWYALGRRTTPPPVLLPGVSVSAAPAISAAPGVSAAVAVSPSLTVTDSLPSAVAAESTAVLESGAHVVDPAAVGGMVGIAPTEKNVVAKRAKAGAVITNDDLVRMN